MGAQWLTAICALLAIAGQVWNVVLNLKLRTALLEQEQRIDARIDLKLKDYQRRDICELEMANHRKDIEIALKRRGAA
jgi:hypothetical protein